MFGDASVTLSAGIDRPEHWPDRKLPDHLFLEEYLKWRADPAAYTPPQQRP